MAGVEQWSSQLRCSRTVPKESEQGRSGNCDYIQPRVQIARQIHSDRHV